MKAEPIDSKSTIQAEAVYVSISNGPDDAQAPEAVATTSTFGYYIIPATPVKRRQCGCGVCCSFLFLFLALFFCLPRTPAVWLSTLKYAPASPSGTASTSVQGTFTGSFAFKNNNYFAVDWSKASMSLYWLPTNPDGQVVTGLCSGSDDPNDACEFWVDGYCAIKLGEFSDSSSFETKPLQKLHHEMALESANPKEVACSTQMVAASLVQGTQLIYSKGHAKAEGWLRKFGMVHVGSAFYNFNLV